MGISRQQLENWAKALPAQKAEQALISIKSALQSYEWPQAIEYQGRLYGSYANGTNITEDGAADVMVLLKTVFVSNIWDQQRLIRDYCQTWYRYQDFQIDVKVAMEDFFGSATVTQSGEFFKLSAPALALKVNVLPCIMYLHFKGSDAGEDRFEGDAFLTSTDQGTQKSDDWIPSDLPPMGVGKTIAQGDTSLRWAKIFPRLHESNAGKKDEQTDLNYKPTVRIFKNIMEALAKDDAEVNITPYFLQCLLYNVPNELFTGEYENIIWNALDWLNSAVMDEFVCQNGCEYLFKGKDPKWQIEKATDFIEKIVDFWNNN